MTLEINASNGAAQIDQLRDDRDAFAPLTLISRQQVHSVLLASRNVVERWCCQNAGGLGDFMIRLFDFDNSICEV